MLRKFKVSNFKSFEKEIELDFTQVKGYEFNKGSIKNSTINNAIIYGQNGVGKSNLALAIFDIVSHLTDKEKMENSYKNYLNAFNNYNYASFYFQFSLNSSIVEYEYRKRDSKQIIYERFCIDNKELILFDRENDHNAKILLAGAESLRSEIDNPELSILKYVKNNTDLIDTLENKTFLGFFKYVEQMLYFRSLLDRVYLGLEIGKKNIFEDIIKRNNVKDFENFLNTAGIECVLSVEKRVDTDTIVFDFNGRKLLFSEVASTGTMALSMFYFWYQIIKNEANVSFVFIDEFDAFYHHKLSQLIVQNLIKTGVQFILTTHNTSIMTNDLLRPDCYFEMTKNNIKSFANSTEKELREGHNIEKMYKAGTFYVE